MVKKRKPGRPRGRTQDTAFYMRTSEDFLEMVDEWRNRQTPILTRAEAIRRLVEMAVKGKKE